MTQHDGIVTNATNFWKFQRLQLMELQNNLKKLMGEMSHFEQDGIDRNMPETEPVQDSLDLDTIRLLVDKARDGDRDAQSQIVEQVQSYLSMMADKNMPQVIRPHMNPSDIVQHTLIQMVNGFENFRGSSTQEFYGWLNQIIKNESKKAARDLTRQKRDVRKQMSMNQQTESQSQLNFEAVDFQATPGTEAIANERIELFKNVLDSLPQDYSTVIQLRTFERLSFNEIGEKMNRTPDAVSKLWYRAIVKFQKEIEEVDDETE